MKALTLIPSRGRFAPHLPVQSVVEGNRRSHGVKRITYMHHCINV